MDYEKDAQEIVKNVGGRENVNALIHCSTRLRFSVNDYDGVNLEALKSMPGVLGAVVAAGQVQVVVGNQVNAIFNTITQSSWFNPVGQSLEHFDKAKTNVSWTARFLDLLVGIFQPLIPAIAGAGVLKSMLTLLTLFGWLSTTSDVYRVLFMAGSAPLYFLPILVAITTAQKLKVNVVVAVAIISVFVLPDMVTALTKGIDLFGISVSNINYASQVFPAILSVMCYAYVERFLNRYVPGAIRIFFVPMMALVIVIPVTLLLLGPIGYLFGEQFTRAILFLHQYLGWFAMAILAGALPFLNATGMHKALVPYVIATLGRTGQEVLYLPASLAHNISESGAAFAIALKSKDTFLRSTAVSAGISALFGITEPALYGVTLLHKAALRAVVIGSAIGAAFLGFVGLKGFAPVGPGLASMTIFVDKNNGLNIWYAVIGFIMSFVVAFVIAFVSWHEERSDEDLDTVESDRPLVVATPVAGQVIPIRDVADEVFASEAMGPGVGIIPENGIIKAPVAGEVVMVYETGHALGIKTTHGTEILLHIGIDTVQLAGKYFKPMVKVGQQVEQGDELVLFDLDQVKLNGFDPTVMMVITNPGVNGIVLPKVSGESTKEEMQYA